MMKKILYIGIQALSILFMCSCANVYADYKTEDNNIDETNEYETLEMKVSYKLNGCVTEVPMWTYDENGNKISFTNRNVSYFYELYFDTYKLEAIPYTFIYEKNIFLADGDTILVSYPKGLSFENFIYENDIINDVISIEKTKSTTIVKVDEELIERKDNGLIKSINVDYIKDDVIVNEYFGAYPFSRIGNIQDVYMSISTNADGEEYCIFYSFNPEEL